MSSMNIRFTEPVSTEGHSRSGESAPSPLPCDKESSDLFTRKLEERSPGKHDLESGESREDPYERTSESPFSMSGMTSPLESLFSNRMEQASAPAHEAVDPADLERMVERILVSTPENGGHEVRLSLGSQLLPDTEIILQRDVNGNLAVTLTTSNTNTFQSLVASQHTLRQMLEKLENNNVRVSVTRDAGQENNDSNRRSRGYLDDDTLGL